MRYSRVEVAMKLTKEDSRLFRKHSEPFRIESGLGFKLRSVDPTDTLHLGSDDKPRAQKALARGVECLSALQNRLYAQDRWSVLLVFQAMDAAGKDSAIDHVFSGVNPQGCQVTSFKAPSSEELDHDFLWRCVRALPERGRIGIFNRSYYEEVLIVRVHEQILAQQKLPPSLVTKKIWQQRYEDIRNFESFLARNGVLILKFFLHVSREEQKRRFLSRIDDHDKNWKFELADVHEREHWDEYMDAYEQMVRHTSAPWAPWYVVPADNKWFTRLVVASAIVRSLDEVDLHYPDIDKRKRAELEQARKALRAERR
jgi:PPK2 family polyphosphate:nucleotide phosphotransferase